MAALLIFDYILQEVASLALGLIKSLLIFKASNRASAEKVLKSPILQVGKIGESYDIYDGIKRPGLCIIISQWQDHNVIKKYIVIVKCFLLLIYDSYVNLYMYIVRDGFGFLLC